MHELIIEIFSRGGYAGLFMLMVIENVIPPIPSEIIMGLGGVLVARDEMQFWPLLLIGTAGATIGNYFWYWLGNRLGYERLRPFVDRWGRWLTVDWDHIESASRFFRRHGQWVIFVLRFSPFMRTIISLPAGLAHMGVWRFLLFTFAGTAIWNAALILGGSALAGYMDRYGQAASLVIGGLIALGLAAYAYRVVTWRPRNRPDVAP